MFLAVSVQIGDQVANYFTVTPYFYFVILMY